MSGQHLGGYIAMIGDLVGSRNTPAVERREIQSRLTDLFATMGAGEPAGAAARPLVTLGDEFQALLTADRIGVRLTMQLMMTVAELARPVGVRFGLGCGELTTDLQPQALGMDGPCFHRARAALVSAHDDDLLCRLDTAAATTDALWSSLASYALRTRAGWTDPQREAIALYEELGAWNKVAERLQVTRGAVSLRQRAAGWTHYRQAWSALEADLVRAVDERGERP